MLGSEESHSVKENSTIKVEIPVQLPYLIRKYRLCLGRRLPQNDNYGQTELS